MYKRSSQILLEIADGNKVNSDLTYSCLLNLLGQRMFGIGILFFSLPNALPLSVIPGVSFVFSLPIIFLALQMILMRKKIWLPSYIGSLKVSHKIVSKIIHTAVPYLIKLETLLRPRWLLMTSRPLEIINGLVLLSLALLLMLPIPFSNLILSVLIILLSLGFVEKDGLFIVIGYMGFVLYLYFIFLFIATIKSFFW